MNLTEPGELKEEPEPTVQLKEETDDDQPSVFELLEDNMKCDDMEKVIGFPTTTCAVVQSTPRIIHRQRSD